MSRNPFRSFPLKSAHSRHFGKVGCFSAILKTYILLHSLESRNNFVKFSPMNWIHPRPELKFSTISKLICGPHLHRHLYKAAFFISLHSLSIPSRFQWRLSSLLPCFFSQQNPLQSVVVPRFAAANAFLTTFPLRRPHFHANSKLAAPPFTEISLIRGRRGKGSSPSFRVSKGRPYSPRFSKNWGF